jgi:hypothetical protein
VLPRPIGGFYPPTPSVHRHYTNNHTAPTPHRAATTFGSSEHNAQNRFILTARLVIDPKLSTKHLKENEPTLAWHISPG